MRSERAAREAAVALAELFEASKEEAARWRDEARDLLRGLSAALDRQFEGWVGAIARREGGLAAAQGAQPLVEPVA